MVKPHPSRGLEGLVAERVELDAAGVPVVPIVSGRDAARIVVSERRG